jgi:hypothetical protein
MPTPVLIDLRTHRPLIHGARPMNKSTPNGRRVGLALCLLSAALVIWGLAEVADLVFSRLV